MESMEIISEFCKPAHTGEEVAVSDGPVVIVDDNKDALLLAKAALREAHVKRELVLLESGPALLLYLGQVSSGARAMPALVLLDINMPGLDGHGTLKQLRALPSFEKEPPVVMLTSSDNEEDRERAVKSGADGYRVKPFGFREYVDLFLSLLS